MTVTSLSSFRQPAEWEPHRATWLAWPSHPELWQEDLPETRSEFVELCRAIAEPEQRDDQRDSNGEKLEILVPDSDAQGLARIELAGLPVRFHRIPFGDIWLRDTAPIFVKSGETVATVQFHFNGWGGKYSLPHDDQVAARVAKVAHLPSFQQNWILEGGSVEVDGDGTCLTTRQCLLNPNRNRGMSQTEIEERLMASLGVKKILWITEGLLNDHTDGHIDTLARFTAPGEVVCMEASGSSDPNAAVLAQIRKELLSFVDARGRKLQVKTVPSPGKVTDALGKILPASYLNFYISNRTVVVPTYGSPVDHDAVEMIGHLFPGRRTIGASAKAILSGGGAFHCITQQEPQSHMTSKGGQNG